MTGGGATLLSVAHPDDEGASKAYWWQYDFPVFVFHTRGERTFHCSDIRLGIGTERCKQERVASTLKHLRAFFRLDHVMTVPGAERYDIYMGPKAAVIFFDQGDGELTQAKARRALDIVAGLKLPVEGFDSVVSSGYYEHSSPGSLHYAHHDHAASYHAVRRYPHPRRVARVGYTNPAVAFGLDVPGYAGWMACSSGAFQQAYAWLRPPCWPSGRDDRDHVPAGFSRYQTFRFL